MENTNTTESCALADNTDNSQVLEKTQQEKESLPPDDILSSILEVPGDIIDGIANVPLDNIVSSTLEIPGNAVKFVAEIPYDKIFWSTLEVSAGLIEFIVDDGFFLGFFMGYYSHN